MSRVSAHVRYGFVAVMLLAGGGLAFGQQAPAPVPSAPPARQVQAVPWSSLTPDQQRLLSRFNWNTLPPERQQALARGSSRWLAMSPEQRGQAQQRYQQWHALPPEKRDELRNRWQRFQSLPPTEQAAVRQNYRRFQQLPPQQRQNLRERWRQATPAQRSEMIQHAREQHMRSMGPAAPREAPGPRPHPR